MERQIKLKGYLKSSHLDKEGAKTIVFEVSHKDALQVAKLELMGRDHKEHLPVLLDIIVRIVDEKATGKRKTPNIRNARGITDKDKRVF